MTRAAVLCGLIMAAAAAAADAQSLFVDGTVFASVERRARAEVEGSTPSSAGPSGSVAGGGATVGAWLTPRLSVRLEAAFPGRVTDTIEDEVWIARTIDATPTRPPVLIPSASIPFTAIYPPMLTQRTERSERIRSVSALLAYHTERRHRLQLSYVGGAAFLSTTRRQRYSITYALPAAPPGTVFVVPERSYESTITDYEVVVEAGIDADAALTSRLSVVPQVRILGVANGLSVRPGVALRLHW